jgi:hypothetical protein
MTARSLAGSADRPIDAAPEHCLALLADVESWPEWISAIRSIGVLERDGSGAPSRVLLEARMLGFPLAFTATVAASPHEFTLRRVAHGTTDPEALELVVQVEPAERGCRASARLSATVDAPRLLPLPDPVADQAAARLLADLGDRATAA